MSAWLAIDDVDIENGALQVIPRSHRNAQIAFADSAPRRTVLNQTVANPEAYGDDPALELRAGARQRLVLHPSPTSTMRFLSSDVRAFQGWNQHSLCAGAWSPAATGPTTRARRRTLFR